MCPLWLPWSHSSYLEKLNNHQLRRQRQIDLHAHTYVRVIVILSAILPQGCCGVRLETMEVAMVTACCHRCIVFESLKDDCSQTYHKRIKSHIVTFMVIYKQKVPETLKVSCFVITSGSFIWFIVIPLHWYQPQNLTKPLGKLFYICMFIVTYWIHFSLVSVSETAVVRVIYNLVQF